MITQRQFQQFVDFLVPSVQFLDRVVDFPVACRSWYAQCTLYSRPWRSHSYSSWDGCRRACCCAATGALVGSCRKLWSVRSCSACGRRPVPGQGCCARWCNDWGRAMLGSTLDTCFSLSREAFGRIFYDFLLEGVDSAPELDSRLAFLAGTSSTTAVACTFLVLLVSCTSRYVPTIAGGLQRSVQSMLRLLAGCTWKPVHYFLRASLDLSACSAFESLRESIFWSPRALTPVSARGLGYRSRRES